MTSSPKTSPKLLQNRTVLSFAISVIIILTMVTLKLTNMIEPLELKGFDLLYKIKGTTPPSEKIVFVDIDDHTLQDLGKFPLPRNIYARALKAAKLFGARQVLFDIEFPEKSTLLVNPPLYKQALKRGGASSSMLRAMINNPDAIFHKEIQKSNTVYFACAFGNQSFKELGVKDISRHIDKFSQNAISLSEDKNSNLYYKNFEHFYVKKSFQKIIEPFFLYQESAGFSNVEHDIDGAIRSVPLFFVFEHGKSRLLIPQMSFNLMLDRYHVKKEDIKIFPGSKVVLKNVQFSRGKKEDIEIPINDRGSMLLSWAGDFAQKGDFIHIPFYVLSEYLKIVEERDIRLVALAETIDDKNFFALIQEKHTLLEYTFQNPYSKSNVDLYRKFNLGVTKTEKEILKIIEKLLADMEKDLTKLSGSEAKETKAFINEINIVRDNFYKHDDALKLLDKLKDATIFIGLTATGTTDIGSVPVNSKGLYPLIGVHGNVANTIIQRDFLARSPIQINLLILVILPLVIGLFYVKYSAKFALLLTSVFTIFTIGFVILSFSLFGYWLDLVSFSSAIFLTGGALSSYEFLSQEKQKKYIKSVFGMYLSPQVIDQITASGGEIELSGEERELTAFFSDIAGFTSISESLSPAELVNVLNEYLTEMSDIIMDQRGTIDKYEGDAIMAFYGAPLADPRHAYNACKAAIEMQKRLESSRNGKWQTEKSPLLRVRMGINSGNMRVGNMGSKQRMDYTIMGDNVNLASRLEGVNKYYKTEIMISEFTYQHVKDDFLVRELDSVRVVGKQEAIRIFELIDYKTEISQGILDILELYNKGKKSYRAKRFSDAKKSFREVLKINPNDGPSLVFLDRCNKYIKDPGAYTKVYSLTSK